MEPAVDFYPHFLEGLKNPVDAAHYLVEAMATADAEKDYVIFFHAFRDVKAAGHNLVDVFLNVPKEEVPNFSERFNCMSAKMETLLREHPAAA